MTTRGFTSTRPSLNGIRAALTPPPRHLIPRGTVCLLAGLLAYSPAVARAQRLTPPPAPGTDSVLVAAGAHYQAGRLHQFFFGNAYRVLWKTPIRVPVLNLATFAGGLRPLKEGGGLQTKSLHLVTPSGVEYVFRGVDKEKVVIPPQFKGTVVEKMARDQVSASHPAGALIVAPLLEAVGILHATPTFVVMPDDPRLGPFRQDYAGRLGMIEESPDTPEHGPGFAGAVQIIDSDKLLKLLNGDPTQQIDGPAFLAARLMDMLFNDWDRHPGQWKWARFGPESPAVWVPIPRDRDKAFVSYSGLVPGVSRMAASNLVGFKGTYPSIRGLTWNSLEFDRRLLSGLERRVWDSVVTSLIRKLPDPVIDAATRAMPKEYSSTAPALAEKLKQRRDLLPDLADRFYRLLATVTDVHATDANDRARIERLGDDTVLIQLQPAAGGPPYFRRRFDRRETREVRLYLHGGNDEALVTGKVGESVPVRIIGGEGNNHLIDSSSVGSHRDPTRLYDNGVVTHVDYGPDTVFNRRPWIRDHGTMVAPGPDYGRKIGPIVSLGVDEDYGAIPRLGLGVSSFGFGTRPYRRYVAVQAEYATGVNRFRVELGADQRQDHSPLHFTVALQNSGLEVIRFQGFGNASTGNPENAFFDVTNHQWSARPALAFSLGSRSDIFFGPVVQYSKTDSLPVRFISGLRPYGFGAFGQAGVELRLHYDVRDQPRDPQQGLLVEGVARYFPAIWDVRTPYEEVSAIASTYIKFPVPLHPILAFRAGGKKLFGSFPYFESAFIGGASTVRNLDAQRFAGDASLFGNAELRLPLTTFSFILPWNVGIFGLADAGRVYFDGDSPGGWHHAEGGGFWIGLADPATSLSFAFTNGHKGAFIQGGLRF